MTGSIVRRQAPPGRRGGDWPTWVLLYVASVFLALALSAVVVEATGGDWWPVLDALIDGSVRRPGRWGETLGIAAPMVLVALGVVVTTKAGLVNIGQEGQLLIGAAVAAYFSFLLGGPGPLNVVLLLGFGALGGAAWAGIAAGLRAWRRVPEVLTTLLLVNIAGQAVAYALSTERLLLGPAEFRGNRNQVSQQLAANNRLPRPDIFGNEIPTAVFLAIGLAVAVAFVLGRTVVGFRLRILGGNVRVAHRAGVSETTFATAALMVGGAFAGFAGAAMLAGGGFAFGNYQFVPGFSANIGWAGLLVALVARERPLVAVPVAFAFAALRTGSSFVGVTGVESRVTDVIEGFLVLSLLLPPAVMVVLGRRRARAALTGDGS